MIAHKAARLLVWSAVRDQTYACLRSSRGRRRVVVLIPVLRVLRLRQHQVQPARQRQQRTLLRKARLNGLRERKHTHQSPELRQAMSLQ